MGKKWFDTNQASMVELRCWQCVKRRFYDFPGESLQNRVFN